MHPTPPQRSNLIWAAIDFDGTLAESVWTPEDPTPAIGDPIWPNIAKVLALVEAGYKIVIHTARASTDYEAIEMWLNYYHVPFSRIITGKILAAIYVDDRSVHADHPDWLAALKEINP